MEQRLRAIEAQIGGGGATLNVNSVTAGDIFVNTNQITTVSGEQINTEIFIGPTYYQKLKTSFLIFQLYRSQVVLNSLNEKFLTKKE